MNLLVAVLLLALPPCPTEDSANCGWNATTQGNGVGTSFVNVDGVLIK